MSILPTVPIIKSARTRVKLYVLNEDRQWDDRGTGYVQAARVERKLKQKAAVNSDSNTSPDMTSQNTDDSPKTERKQNAAGSEDQSATNSENTEPEPEGTSESHRKHSRNSKSDTACQSLVLFVVSEVDGAPLLRSKVRAANGYQKQQDTLIVWADGNLDLALSFQERTGCDDVWELICSTQADFNDRSASPPATCDSPANSQPTNGADSDPLSHLQSQSPSRSERETSSADAEDSGTGDLQEHRSGESSVDARDALALCALPNEVSETEKKSAALDTSVECYEEGDEAYNEEVDDDEYGPAFVAAPSDRNAAQAQAQSCMMESAGQSCVQLASSNMSGCVPFELPECDLAHLTELVEALHAGSASVSQKEMLTDALLLANGDYLCRVRDLFRKCEKLDAIDLLPHFHELAKCLLVLNRPHVFEYLFSDEACFLDLIGMLEYDPALNTGALGCGSPPRTTQTSERLQTAQVVTLPSGARRYGHREFLANAVRFKQVYAFERDDVLEKIHKTFRVQYVLENILPTPTIFEENQFAGLTTFLFTSKLKIANLVVDDQHCLTSLFDEIAACAQRLTGSDGLVDQYRDRLTDLVQFVRELCSFTQSHTQHAKDVYFRRMASLGIMRAIECTMRSALGGTVRSAIIEIFSYAVEFAPTVVRDYVILDSAQSSKPLFLNLVIEMLLDDDDPELSNAIQLGTVLRSLLDPDPVAAATQPGVVVGCTSGTNMKNDKAEFLKLFYAKCVPVLIAPLLAAVDGSPTDATSPNSSSNSNRSLRIEPSHDDYETALRLAIVVDLLAFFIERHNYHMKNLVSSRELLRKVLVLLGSRHSFLALTALRLFRRVVGLKDAFYTQHAVQTGCGQPVVDLLLRHAARQNLVNSALLEFFHFVNTEDIRPLAAHFAELLADRLRTAPPECTQVLRQLKNSCERCSVGSASLSDASSRRGAPCKASVGEDGWFSTQLLRSSGSRTAVHGKRNHSGSNMESDDADSQDTRAYDFGNSHSLTTDRIRRQLNLQMREAEREDDWFAYEEDDLDLDADSRPQVDAGDPGESDCTSRRLHDQPDDDCDGDNDDDDGDADDDDIAFTRSNSRCLVDSHADAAGSAPRKRRRLTPLDQVGLDTNADVDVDADADDPLDEDEDTDELDRVWHQRFVERQNAYARNAKRNRASRATRITIHGRSGTTSSAFTVNAAPVPTPTIEESTPVLTPLSPVGDVVVKSPVSSLVDYPDDDEEAPQQGVVAKLTDSDTPPNCIQDTVVAASTPASTAASVLPPVATQLEADTSVSPGVLAIAGSSNPLETDAIRNG